jgi:ribosomal peptide maturation radical SAM protein 1
MPSIQLATVKSILRGEGIIGEVYEFYVDFVAEVGAALYDELDNRSFVLAEKVFSPFAFPGFAAAHGFPDLPARLGKFDADLERVAFYFLQPLASRFLERCLAETDWSRYEAICFSLTTVQTTASIALAHAIRTKVPNATIIFGGTSCAGEMGRALAELCGAVDIVVHGEAETTLPPLIAAVRRARDLRDVPGITYREEGSLVTTGRPHLLDGVIRNEPMDFDAYFERRKRLGLSEEIPAWIPFETSRGCWYGEKNQCTFCGLNEIIKYRKRRNEDLPAELSAYAERYGVGRFFSVDLIMPIEYPNTVLPRIEALGKDWLIFYEVKSNLKRKELEQLRRAGVRWIQPGIESLDDAILKLMNKGVSAAQNTVFLKWCRELGIDANWNLITGFPGETAGSYEALAALIPKIAHLQPPTGVGDFEVHRFSPYFNSPGEFGLEISGPDARYRFVFPGSDELLSRLVYRFDYRTAYDDAEVLIAERARVRELVVVWHGAARDGARLDCFEDEDGLIEIEDGRKPSRPVEVHQLTWAQSKLYSFLDERRGDRRLGAAFRQYASAAHEELGGDVGIQDQVDRWLQADLLLRLGGSIIGLAVRKWPRPVSRAQTRHPSTEAQYV